MVWSSSSNWAIVFGITVSNVTTSSSSWLLRGTHARDVLRTGSGRREHADVLDRPVAAIEREEPRPAQCVEPGAAAAVDEPHYLGDGVTDFSGRIAWLAQLREMPWIRAVLWSQLPSRGQGPAAGHRHRRLGRPVRPPAAAQMREIIRNGLR
jgi:hypothetical protein